MKQVTVPDTNDLIVTEDDLPRIKLLYNHAVEKNKQIVAFKNQLILTGYLKYLIEHLES